MSNTKSVTKNRTIHNYKIYQTKLHDPQKGIRGNCFAASLATWLSLPLAVIPQFEELEECYYWKSVLNKFLEGYDLEWLDSDKPLSNYFSKDFPEYLQLHLRSGPSPRCDLDSDDVFNHCALYWGEDLFFDPHPDGVGISQVDTYSYLRVREV